MYLNHGQFSISSSHLGTPGQLIQTVFQIFVHLNTMTGKTEEIQPNDIKLKNPKKSGVELTKDKLLVAKANAG